MVYGVIYCYYWCGEDDPLYIGKTSGCYSVASALRARHNCHMHGKTPFDAVLRIHGAAAFELRALRVIPARTATEARSQLKAVEVQAIQQLRPTYNVKFRRGILA